MPEEFGDNKLTQAEADKLMSPLENDLTALFSYMRDDMLETLLDYEGTPEGFIDAILGPLSEEGGPVAKDMQTLKEGGEIMKSKCDEKKVMSPGPGEDEQKFVSRCISHEMGKGKDQKQAAAICYSIFRESKKDMVIKKTSEVIKSITQRVVEKALPVGTKRQRKDGTYEKQSNGKWKKVTEKKESKEDQKKKVSQEEQKERNKNIRKKYSMPKAAEASLQSLMEKGSSGKNLWAEYGIDADQELVGAAWLAGEKGTPMPFINVGWRWGEAQGASHNFAENKDEAGVSTAKMKGFKKINSFAADPNGRKKHFYIGYVVTHDTGGDDELLFVPEGKFGIKEISEEDYNNFEPEIPDLGDWWYKGRLEKEE